MLRVTWLAGATKLLDHVDNAALHARRAILSIARKNGKTALIAAIALAHLVGRS
jgi:phage terminase large subunit-like protein